MLVGNSSLFITTLQRTFREALPIANPTRRQFKSLAVVVCYRLVDNRGLHYRFRTFFSLNEINCCVFHTP
jgi:hypothetical protein